MSVFQPSPRDVAARQALEALGMLTPPAPEVSAELSPERSVMLAMAWHIGRIEARVEMPHGGDRALRFRAVRFDWPRGTEPASYPAATVLPQTTTPSDAQVCTPVQDAGGDIISADERWALWHVGEDVGEGLVHIFAAHQAHRDALAKAVEDAMHGDLDTLFGIALALPEMALPAPFRSVLEPAAFPRIHAWLHASDAPGEREAGETGIWRADVRFRWQAPRLLARARIPDLQTDVVVHVGEE